MSADLDYISLNAMINLRGADGNLQLDKDKEAVRNYFLENVNQNTVFFHNLQEKLDYLVENDYYEAEFLEKYSFEEIKDLYKLVYSFKFRFKNFVGALKFYNQYALKNFKADRYLERFEDRVAATALYLADGDIEAARKLAIEIITQRYQPATPTFLNAGKKQRGDLISCYLLETGDSMESIAENIRGLLQLSKRGGGVAINLSSLREAGAPIKKIEGASAGVLPVMKLCEDAASYANQLGARQGACAVYLNAHHPDIMEFLDTKRENADEKVRIKTLSLGVVIPDITFQLAKENRDMYLFSPYDVERIYGVSFPYVNITEEYDNMVENAGIRKKKINARKFLQTLAELQFESGYPYILFEDNANRQNPIKGKITMSNLCVTGETKLLTKQGYRSVKELAESGANSTDAVVDIRARDMTFKRSGLEVEEGTAVVKTAENADILKVTTSNGQSLRATAWHKMYAVRDDKIVKLPLNELVVGDTLLAQKGGWDYAAPDTTEDADLAYLLGIVTLNGKVEGKTVSVSVENTIETIIRYELAKNNYGDDLYHDEQGTIHSKNLKTLLDKVFPGWGTSQVPAGVLRAAEKVQVGYLHGFFQAQSVRTGAPEFLADLQLLAVSIQAPSSLDQKAGTLTLHQNEDYTGLITVTDITFDGKEDVYDLTVPNGHSVIFNGIATGQCSEILQVQTPSSFNLDGTYQEIGTDISCNLGSLNIANVMDDGDFEKTVDISMRALSAVSLMSTIDTVPSIDKANHEGRAVGLGHMNLHGYLAREHIHYDSPEAIEFTSAYFAAINYFSLKSSNAQAVETQDPFVGFEDSDYANGSYFNQYLENDYNPKSDRVKELFTRSGIKLPTKDDWAQLKESVMSGGLYHRNRLAVAPTGSISYVTSATSSIHPITSMIEVRKESLIGRCYVPAPNLNESTIPYYRSAYDIGPEPIIDIYAAATPHVDQGLSCTLFFKHTATTRDVNRAQLYAYRKGLKTLYYVRISQDALEGTAVEDCVSCTI